MSICLSGTCMNERDLVNNFYCSSCVARMSAGKTYHAEEGVEAGEFEYEDDMLCPYCDKAQTDLFEVTGAYEDGEHEVTCQHCSEEFDLVTRVEYTYSTYIKKEEDL